MRNIDDRILELRTAIGSAQNSGGRSASQSTQLYIRDLQGQIDRLEQAKQRNIELPNDGSVPYFVPMALGAAYFRSGRFADAEREYKEAIAGNAASGETHNNLAVLYLTTGRYDEADSEVRAAEKVGFKVNENLKGDIRKKKAGGLP
jgi:tetratricopeptide (TPR) repeat protein